MKLRHTFAKLVCMALLLLLTVGFTGAQAEANPLSDFEYTIWNDRVLLTKYKGTSAEVTVAGSYVIDGVSYGVTLDTATVFNSNASITFVGFESGIQFATTVDGTLRPNSMKGLFQNCTKLLNVDLSKVSTVGVTDMSYLFSNCLVLQAVDFSTFDTSDVTTLEWLLDRCQMLTSLTGYENWNTGKVTNIYKTFNRVTHDYREAKYYDTRLQQIDISKWDLSKVKNSGWCFQKCYVNSILLPDNLAVMSAGFLNHLSNYEGTSFTVPAGVKKIGYAHNFYDLGKSTSMVELKVAPGNTHYKAVDGIIYSMDGTELLGMPRAKQFENNTFVIPEGVTFLGELSFCINTSVQTVVLPNSLVIRQPIPENDPQYIVFEDNGNLNGGNSLTVATYTNSGVRKYDVKADNPRYAAKDGIIYSRDMAELIAVPVRYNQKINIPEGVVRWLPEAVPEYASWDSHLKSTGGVSIPASMLNIAPSQVVKLNRVATAASSPFVITVAEGNPVYYVENKELKMRESITGATVTLSGDVIYDGTEKKPAFTVKVGDKTLTEGTDYTVTYMNNVNAGTATVRITGKGAYPGEQDVTFTIQPRSIADAEVLLLNVLTYNGETQTQLFELRLPGGLTATYTVEGDKACNAGVYQLTATGTGNFTGTVSSLYEIAALDKIPETGDRFAASLWLSLLLLSGAGLCLSAKLRRKSA